MNAQLWIRRIDPPDGWMPAAEGLLRHERPSVRDRPGATGSLLQPDT